MPCEHTQKDHDQSNQTCHEKKIIKITTILQVEEKFHFMAIIIVVLINLFFSFVPSLSCT